MGKSAAYLFFIQKQNSNFTVMNYISSAEVKNPPHIYFVLIKMASSIRKQA